MPPYSEPVGNSRKVLASSNHNRSAPFIASEKVRDSAVMNRTSALISSATPADSSPLSDSQRASESQGLSYSERPSESQALSGPQSFAVLAEQSTWLTETVRWSLVGGAGLLGVIVVAIALVFITRACHGSDSASAGGRETHRKTDRNTKDETNRDADVKFARVLAF
jgi:hypothetical protein